jgi:arsenate reductase
MSDAFPVLIFHNPGCGTSRNTLAMIHAAGYEPDVIEYLKVGWTRPALDGLLRQLNLSAGELLRTKGTSAEAFGLTEPTVSEAAILDAMVADPSLVNRPIVVTPLGAKLCRPSEAVLDILERRPASFTKEDGEVVPL